MPLGGMNRRVDKRVESTLGCVEEIDIDDDDVGWGKCLRVHIWMDLTKPIA